MARYYYPNNEILTPRWATPQVSKFPWALVLIPLAIVALLAALGAWLFFGGLFGAGDAKRATVLIWVDNDGDGRFDSQGSGVIINSRGYVLTNKHVARGSGGTGNPKKYEVWFMPGSKDVEKMPATLEKSGEGSIDLAGPPSNIDNDWAVLRVATKETLPFLRPATRRDFNPEEKVTALGYPMADVTATSEYGPSIKVVNGEISRVDRSNTGGVIRLTHTATVAGGNSGGPLVEQGKIVGLNTQINLKGGNENYALPTYLLQEGVFRAYGEGGTAPTQ